MHADAAAKGALRSFQEIYAKEGVSALYRGFSVTLIGAGPRGAIGFGIFETMKPWIAGVSFFQDNAGAGKFICGYVAGLLSEVVTYPLDTIRRRQQVTSFIWKLLFP